MDDYRIQVTQVGAGQVPTHSVRRFLSLFFNFFSLIIPVRVQGSGILHKFQENHHH